MRSFASKHLIFHLIFKLCTPESDYFTSSTYQTMFSSWKSNCTTNSSDLDSENKQETIGTTDYIGVNTTVSDRESHYNDTTFSYKKEAYIHTTDKFQTEASTVIENEDDYKYTTGGHESTYFEPGVTTKKSSESDANQLYKMDSCAKYSTCEHVSNLSFQFCQCDQPCSMYKDCCADFSNSLANAEYSVECIQTSSQRHDGIFAVARCPNTLNETDEISRKCRRTDLLEVGPLVVDEDGFVYRNRFCAECHSKTRVRMFSVVISNVPNDFLDRHVNDTSHFKLKELMFFIQRNNVRGRPLLEQVPPNGQNVRRCIQFKPGSVSCPDYYTSPVKTKKGIYRNKFCISKVFKCLGYRFHASDLDKIYTQYRLFPLSVMFSFGRSTDVDCLGQVTGICVDQEMYREYEASTEFILTSTTMLSDLHKRQLLLVFLWTLPSDIRISSINTSPTDIFNSTLHVEFELQVSLSKEMGGKQMLAYKTMIENLQCQIVVHRVEAEPLRIHIKRTKIINRANKTFDRLFNHRTVSDCVIKAANVNISIKKKEVTCLWNTIECEFIGNTSLLLQDVKCMDEIVYRTTKEHSKIKIYMTYIGLGISVLGLIVSLITHRCFGMHTTIPGSNTENLSVSLLLSNILFLFGIGANDYPNVCYIVGVSLHYLWLSVFSFMSIATINMFHDLRKMALNAATAQKSKTKAILTICGLIGPTIFVVPSVTLYFLKIDGFNPKYDGNICFPKGYPAAVIFVYLPIGLSILVNLICFIGIAAVLTKHSIASRNIRKSNSYQNAFVYARISVVTGIFWTTGLLGLFMPSETVDYIFIVCCSLQGFLVALCNLTTKRVIKYVKEYLED